MDFNVGYACRNLARGTEMFVERLLEVLLLTCADSDDDADEIGSGQAVEDES